MKGIPHFGEAEVFKTFDVGGGGRPEAKGIRLWAEGRSGRTEVEE
jgi:hypothetical protein